MHLRLVITLFALANATTILSSAVRPDSVERSESVAAARDVDNLLGQRQVFRRDDKKNDGKDDGDGKEKKPKNFICKSDADCAANPKSPLFGFEEAKCDKTDPKDITCVILCKQDDDCVAWAGTLRKPVKLCPAEYPITDKVRKEIGPRCAFCSTGPMYAGQCVSGFT